MTWLSAICRTTAPPVLSPVRLVAGVGGTAVESKSWMILWLGTDMLRTLSQAVCVIGNNHRRGEARR